MNIYKKLVEVRKSCPYLKKDKTGHNCKYTSGSTVIGAIRQKIDDLNLFLTTEIKGISFPIASKDFAVLEIEYVWINADSPEEKLTIAWRAIGQKQQIEQAIGSALTYAERYFLLKFFNIPTDNMDPDLYKERFEENEEKLSEPTEIDGFLDSWKALLVPPTFGGESLVGYTWEDLCENPLICNEKGKKVCEIMDWWLNPHNPNKKHSEDAKILKGVYSKNGL